MTHAQINQAITETIVRRSFREIKKDPKRAIRNLVDVGRENAGGQLQQKFLDLAQRILKRTDSPYYALIQNTIQSVDEEYLLTFGMNLGWNSLTQGAKQIRSEESKLGFNIPWALALHLESQPDSLSAEAYLRLIAEGIELGIYSYFLRPRDVESVKLALDLASANQDCAFCLLLPEEFRYEDMQGLSRSMRCTNMLWGINSCSQDWAEQVQELQNRRYPYLICRTYATKEDVTDIVSGNWVESILPHAGIAAVILAAGDIDPQEDAKIYSYALDSRLGQRYPTLVIDFYQDNLYIDVCISGDPCFLGILPNGQITQYRQGREMPTDLSAQTAPLVKILQQFPKQVQGLN